jgi:peptidoglycan/xylan/chitin deacetylase (PgdA/CDA1 family)
MSLITRLTHQAAKLLLNPQHYVTALPGIIEACRPSVYLTFDDGPHPDRTNRILDQFAEAGGHGTFFVIGRRARRDPQTLRRMLREGHAIGCHTWRHWSARRLPSQIYLDDVRRSRDEIQQLTGQPIDLFRPPYGELTPLTLLRLMTEGFRIIQWTHDTRDFLLPTVSALSRRFDHETLSDGDIVLMHDDRCVTSYGLGGCLRKWGPRAEFRPIPMRPRSAMTDSSIDTNHQNAVVAGSAL